jgi:glc operon protein GlcG
MAKMMTRLPAGAPIHRAGATCGAILAVLMSCAGVRAPAQEPLRGALAESEKKAASDIIDEAKLFSPTAVESSRGELRRLEREKHVATIIQTIDSLGGLTLADVTTRRAQRSGIHGVFVLIPKKEKKIELLVSGQYRKALPPSRQETIRTAFTDNFRRGAFDQGLERGVAAIGEALAAAQRSGALPRAQPVPFLPESIWPPGSGGLAGAPLVTRNQVRLTLAGARIMIAGAEARARAMQLAVNIAVADDGGHLIAFQRMDGARPASIYTAITKATSAATIRMPTGPLKTSADPLLNVSLQNAAAASGGKITTLLGGVPVQVDGQVIGAVGVGGGTGEQDAQIARAGIQMLTDRLARPLAVEKDTGAPASAP